MSQVTIYTAPRCGFCHRAKQLLKSKGVSYTEIDIGAHPEKRSEMIKAAGGAHTVPQIFIGDSHVGGSDDLSALERSGKLDGMLGK